MSSLWFLLGTCETGENSWCTILKCHASACRMLGCEERTLKQFVFVVRYALVVLMGSVETGAPLVIRSSSIFSGKKIQKPWQNLMFYVSRFKGPQISSI